MYPAQYTEDPEILPEQSLSGSLGDPFPQFHFPMWGNGQYGTEDSFTFDASVYPCLSVGPCSSTGWASDSFSSSCIAQFPAALYYVTEVLFWTSLKNDSNPDQLECIDPRLTVKSEAVYDPLSHVAQLPALETDLYDEDGELVGKLLPDNFKFPRHRVSVDIPAPSGDMFVACFSFFHTRYLD